MNDNELRIFYDTLYEGYTSMPAYEDAPAALKLRLRLAWERVEDARRQWQPRARVVKVERRVAA